VLEAARLVGTPRSDIVMTTTPGGHIGLFMGSKTLAEVWPGIGHWMKSHETLDAPRRNHRRSTGG